MFPNLSSVSTRIENLPLPTGEPLAPASWSAPRTAPASCALIVRRRPCPLVTADRQAIKELFNLRVVGLNVNRYLNRQLLELKQIGQVRDAAVMREYGGQMH